MTTVQSVLYELREKLPMFVVYDHPSDYPDHFVARLWVSLPIPQPMQLQIRSAHIESLRDIFEQAGLTLLTRSEHDEPVILETWI
jgi:hypothetical protein